jgi:hypothetical protein
MHVGGNAMAMAGFGKTARLLLSLVTYNSVINVVTQCDCDTGSLLEALLLKTWAVAAIFEVSVVVGSLGHSLTFPYDGLVGCSMGVYGLIGACWPLIIYERHRIHPLILRTTITILLLQIAVDLFGYICDYDAQVSYVAHFCGFATGILLGCSLGILDDRSDIKIRCAACIPMLVFFTFLGYLIFNYVENWPPAPYRQDILHNDDPSDMRSCCARAFEYIEQERPWYDMAFMREIAYCDNNVLKFERNSDPV